MFHVKQRKEVFIMSMNIYEISRVNSTALFTRDEEVNSRLFDMVELFQTDAANAKKKAELCYDIANAPCFGENGQCEKTDPYKVIETTFGKLLTVSTAKKYSLIVSRFAKSDDMQMKELYLSFPMGKLIILSPLTSDKNVKDGYTVKAFFVSTGKAENDKVRETWADWEKTNELTLAKIDKMRGVDDEIVEMLTGQLAPEPEKPCADDDFSTLYAMGLAIVKKLSDSELKKRIADYLPGKPEKKSNGQTDGQTDGQPDETPEEKTARLKAAAAAALAEYIAAAQESGDKVSETVKQVARKIGAKGV